MARPRKAPPEDQSGLLARALDALRKKAKPSSEKKGWLEFQPKGGANAYVAKALRIGGAQARSLVDKLKAQGLVEIQSMGPGQPWKVSVKTGGKAGGGRPTASTARRKTAAKRTSAKRGAAKRKTAAKRRPGRKRTDTTGTRRRKSAAATPPAETQGVEGILSALRSHYEGTEQHKQELEAALAASESRAAKLEAQLAKARLALE